MTTPVYPLTFTPQLRDYVWGGRNLERLYNRPLPPGIIAESWEISGHPDASTVVNNGPLAGQLLPDVLAALGEKLVGTHAAWALERHRFPLLVKLLDANRNLSVQVHPKDDYALEHEDGELGKTEMWYVLHAEPDARVIFGLKPNVTAEGFRQAIINGTLENKLHYLPVQTGDTIFVEAGSVHALLEGIVVAEIQQNSNITYRVYDWGRLGTDGKPRELHVNKAIDVISYDQVEPEPYRPKTIFSQSGLSQAEISRCDYFVVEQVDLDAGITYHGYTDGTSLEIWGTIQGQSELNWANDQIDLPTIQFVLVPAALGDFSITAERSCRMLRVYLP